MDSCREPIIISPDVIELLSRCTACRYSGRCASLAPRRAMIGAEAGGLLPQPTAEESEDEGMRNALRVVGESDVDAIVREVRAEMDARVQSLHDDLNAYTPPTRDRRLPRFTLHLARIAVHANDSE